MDKKNYCQHFNKLKISKNIQVANASCKFCLIGKSKSWMCISKNCQNYFCQSNNNQHMLMHTQQHNQDNQIHCIFINVNTTQIKCLACKIQILDLDLLKCDTEGFLDPYQIRLKILPSLQQLTKKRLSGQLQNSEGHKKYNSGLVGIFGDKYNNLIIAALQFIHKCTFIKEIILQSYVDQKNQFLFQLKDIMIQLEKAQLRAIKIDSFANIVYEKKTEILNYKRRDPFDIISLILINIHDEIKFLKKISPILQNQTEQSQKYKSKNNYTSPLSQFIQTSLSMNYECHNCNRTRINFHDIQFFRLKFPKERAKPKQMEKQLQQYRPLSSKSRRKSLINYILNPSYANITIHQLLIQFLKQKNQKIQMCPICKIKMKQNKSHIQNLPSAIMFVIDRIHKDSHQINNTIVDLQTNDIDFGSFTLNKQQMIYQFQSAVCIQKNVFFSVIAKNQLNKQLYLFKNQLVQYTKSTLNPFIICYRKKINSEIQSSYKNISSNVTLLVSPDYLLPDFWLTKLKHGLKSQLIHQLVCFHNKLKPNIRSKMTKEERVPLPVYEALVEKYGGKLYKNIQCQQCKLDIESIEVRRQAQRQLIKTYCQLKTNINCMIEVKWVNRWSEFLYQKSEAKYSSEGYPMPGRINNKNLLENGVCRAGIKKNDDYKVVNFFIWKILHYIYGGGPQIRYKWKKQKLSIFDEHIIKQIKIKAQQVYQLSPFKTTASAIRFQNEQKQQQCVQKCQ